MNCERVAPEVGGRQRPKKAQRQRAAHLSKAVAVQEGFQSRWGFLKNYLCGFLRLWQAWPRHPENTVGQSSLSGFARGHRQTRPAVMYNPPSRAKSDVKRQCQWRSRLILRNWNVSTKRSKISCTKRSTTFPQMTSTIVEIKRRKLQVKDEIERLRSSAIQSTDLDSNLDIISGSLSQRFGSAPSDDGSAREGLACSAQAAPQAVAASSKTWSAIASDDVSLVPIPNRLISRQRHGRVVPQSGNPAWLPPAARSSAECRNSGHQRAVRQRRPVSPDRRVEPFRARRIDRVVDAIIHSTSGPNPPGPPCRG